MTEGPTLADAIGEHVRPGDVLCMVTGHTRWTAAARELVRQWWGRDPGFTLVIPSLSSLGTLFFRGGLVRKVVTGYSGDTFPNFTPNPIFAAAYTSGEVAVEHWSFLALAQRLEAAARGLPAVTTRSIAGSSMESNDAFASVATPFGDVGLLAPLAPDITLLHAPVADLAGNVAVHPPLLEGVWGRSRRAEERSSRSSGSSTTCAHGRTSSGSRRTGCSPSARRSSERTPAGSSRAISRWTDTARTTSSGSTPAPRRASDTFDAWIDHWVLEVVDQRDYLDRLGADRVAALRAKAAPDSWRADVAAYPSDVDAPPNRWELAATWGARYLAERALALDADAVLAGAGVANLAAWLGVAQARSAEPRPADR